MRFLNFLILFLFPLVASGETKIEIPVEDLVVTYGIEQTTHVVITPFYGATVSWNAGERGLPPGLTLEQTAAGDKVELKGAPLFSGRWCFDLVADSMIETITQRFCYASRNNFHLDHPQLVVEKNLMWSFAGTYAENYLNFDVRKTPLTAMEVSGYMPTELTAIPYLKEGVLKFKGTMRDPDSSWTFEVSVTNAKGLTNHYQVRVIVPADTVPLSPLEPEPEP